MSSIPARSRYFLQSDILWVLGVIVCSLTGFAEVTKYFHGVERFAFATAIALSITAAMAWLRWMQLKPDHRLRLIWLFLLWGAFAALFAVLFPISQHHVLGVGSDREDALRAASYMLVHGRYLYDARTYLGNAITPLPGAVLFAVPFYLLGCVALQNLLWLALFLVFSVWFFRDRSTALVYVLLILGTSAGSLDDFVVGGDFFINTVYVCVALGLVLATYKKAGALWPQIGTAVVLGLAVDSRPIYIVVFPLMFAYLWQREALPVAIRALLIAGATAALWSFPFYFYSPSHFAPLHVTHKLDFIPAALHPTLLFPALGILASCAGFFLRLNRRRLYLLIGISLFFMVGIPGLVEWYDSPFTLNGWYGIGLLGTPALFVSLWLFSRFQQNSAQLRGAAQPTHSAS